MRLPREDHPLRGPPQRPAKESGVNTTRRCLIHRARHQTEEEKSALLRGNSPQTRTKKGAIKAVHPNEEGLGHAVGFFNLRLPSVRIDGCLDDLHDVIAELQLQANTKR